MAGDMSGAETLHRSLSFTSCEVGFVEREMLIRRSPFHCERTERPRSDTIGEQLEHIAVKQSATTNNSNLDLHAGGSPAHCLCVCRCFAGSALPSLQLLPPRWTRSPRGIPRSRYSTVSWPYFQGNSSWCKLPFTGYISRSAFPRRIGFVLH